MVNLVHVNYQVGSRKETLKNVDLDELHALLLKLSQTKPSFLASSSELSQEKRVASYIANLNRTEGVKFVHADSDESCTFNKNFWQSKTPAVAFVCMVEAEIRAIEKQAEKELDNKVRAALSNAAPVVPDEMKPFFVTKQDVDNYIVTLG
jgi:hypothetical protein